MTDLTVKKMREAIKLVNGRWPPDTVHVKDNEFYIKSNLHAVDYEGYDMIRKLGFEDVTIYADQDNKFAFTFIWKKEKKK